jgi:hypothetical protein
MMTAPPRPGKAAAIGEREKRSHAEPQRHREARGNKEARNVKAEEARSRIETPSGHLEPSARLHRSSLDPVSLGSSSSL